MCLCVSERERVYGVCVVGGVCVIVGSENGTSHESVVADMLSHIVEVTETLRTVVDTDEPHISHQSPPALIP